MPPDGQGIEHNEGWDTVWWQPLLIAADLQIVSDEVETNDGWKMLDTQNCPVMKPEAKIINKSFQ